MKRKSIYQVLAVAALGMLTACTAGGDLYDPAKVQKLQKEEYKANFIRNFGAVSPDYSWDATSAYPKYATTRAVVDYSPVIGDYYYVEDETLDWLQGNLKKWQDNSHLGKPVAMAVPNNKFTIVPIYQGEAAYEWDLHMVVGDVDTKIWEKYQGIQYRKGGASDWNSLRFLGKRNTTDVDEVRGKQYTFDLTGVAGEFMYLYLETKILGLRRSSLNGMMLSLEGCNRPTNIPEGQEVMILGCEDSWLSMWTQTCDMSDVVFLIYGDPYVPRIIDLQGESREEGEDAKEEDSDKPTEVRGEESITKRYMIEDLGTTNDQDFNDVVVDVTENRTKVMTVVNGVITETRYENVVQKAVIRHLGGTLPFRLTIGNTVLSEMEGKLGEDPNTEYEIQGWVPAENNISVSVGDKKNPNAAPLLIEFPENGDIPMIIAVDPEVMWMEERRGITKEWFESNRKN